MATKHQLFQFNGSLYKQIDAMGSPLGPLMANTFMCSIEEKLESEDKLPSLHKRHVDDTLAAAKDIPTATAFLATLNEAHPAISFTMEVANNDKLPFIGMELTKIGKQLKTCVYRKTTNKLKTIGHFQVPLLCVSVSKRVSVRNNSYDENDFDLHENEPACRTHFHKNGFALRLVLKQRSKRTRKWPIKAWLFPYWTQKLGGWSIFYSFNHISLKLFQTNRLANLVIFSWMIYAN